MHAFMHPFSAFCTILSMVMKSNIAATYKSEKRIFRVALFPTYVKRRLRANFLSDGRPAFEEKKHKGSDA